jgi:hypothetical protein
MQQIMQQISGGDMSGMVQNRPQVQLPTPIMPKQIPMGELNQINATTAGGQKRNDISSLINSVGNIVKAGVNKKREKDSRDLEADLALITAASSNPQDPHNRAILDALSQDPKRMKRLEKAIGYNPLSGEPPPPETRTMMKFSQDNQQKQAAKQQQLTQAIAQHLGPQAAQQGGASPQSVPGQQPGHAMDALMARSPNVQQLNPMVQLQAGLIKAGVLPSADKSLSALTGLFKDIMTNDAKYAEIQAKLQTQDRALAGKLEEVRARGKFLIKQEKMRQEGAGARTKVRAGATVESAKVHAKATVDAAKVRAENIAEKSRMQGEHKLLQKRVAALDQDVKNKQVEIAADPKNQSLKNELKALQELKEAKEQLMETYDKQIGQLKDKLNEPAPQVSPTDQLRSGGDDEPNPDDMDKEDRIF